MRLWKHYNVTQVQSTTLTPTIYMWMNDKRFDFQAWLQAQVEIQAPILQVLISGSETSSERRVQIWTPDYLLSSKPRPNIVSAPTSVDYNGTITIAYSNVPDVDRVVLIRPSSATHGLHFDERSVVLTCSPASNGSVTCTAPPNANIAPPGNYMLFILYSGVPSMASFISVPLEVSQEPAPSLSSIAAAPSSGITGPASAPLAAEAPQGPSGFGNYSGSDGENPPDFVSISQSASGSTSGTGSGAGTAG